MTDEHRIDIEIPLEATPDEVWDAISTVEGMTAWFFPMEVAPDENGDSPGGKVTRWEPGRGYTVVAEGDTFEYLIEARDGGSAVLRFSQTGFSRDDWEAEYEATARGWGLYFHTLALYLSMFKGRSCDLHPCRRPRCVEDSGGLARTAVEAWCLGGGGQGGAHRARSRPDRREGRLPRPQPSRDHDSTGRCCGSTIGACSVCRLPSATITTATRMPSA